MDQYTLAAGDIVLLAPSYVVFQGGVYSLLDLVFCRRLGESEDVPTCMFLAATVVGIEINEGNS